MLFTTLPALCAIVALEGTLVRHRRRSASAWHIAHEALRTLHATTGSASPASPSPMLLGRAWWIATLQWICHGLVIPGVGYGVVYAIFWLVIPSTAWSASPVGSPLIGSGVLLGAWLAQTARAASRRGALAVSMDGWRRAMALIVVGWWRPDAMLPIGVAILAAVSWDLVLPLPTTRASGHARPRDDDFVREHTE